VIDEDDEPLAPLLIGMALAFVVWAIWHVVGAGLRLFQ
jgi:hypothetical protein